MRVCVCLYVCVCVSHYSFNIVNFGVDKHSLWCLASKDSGVWQFKLLMFDSVHFVMCVKYSL